jgi:YrbI family 3-deoxy-D-manno-octulosonate 8-phosphate phosphatase
LLLSDVDGVLTDGGIVYDVDGREIKRFHVRDGLAIKLWHRAGYGFGIVTGRSSPIVARRAEELRIDIVRQGVERKLSEVKHILHELELQPEEAAFIGDDLPDLAAMQYVGLGITVADASPEVIERADYITKHRGGHGAVREAIAAILSAQGKWEGIVHAATRD